MINPPAPNSEGPDYKPKLTKDELLNALDAQIKVEADSLRNEGWTQWAIWGALAALIWVATDLWIQPNLTLSQMVVVSVMIFIGWKFLETGIWAILPSSRIIVGPARFRPSADIIHPLRPAVAVAVIQYGLILGLLCYFQLWSLWICLAYAGVAFLGCACTFLLDRVTTGFPDQISTKTVINGLVFGQLIFLFLAGIQSALLIIATWKYFTQADVRLALVLNSSVFLISRLLAANSSEHFLNKLTNLRQHLAFNRIRPDDAVEKAEELLSGVTLDKLLKPLIEAIVSEEAKLQVAIAEANRRMAQAKERMHGANSGPQDALRLLDKLGSPPEIVANQLIKNKRAWGKFVMQAVGIAFYSQASRAEIKATSDNTRQKLADVDAKLNACYAQYNELKRQAAEFCQENQEQVSI